MKNRMRNHGLPPELVDLIVGFVPIEINGITTGLRVYIEGDHPELVAYGTHVRLLPGKNTQSHVPETVVDIELDPLPSDYYLG